MVEISFLVSAHASTSMMYDMCSAQRVKFSRARDAKLTEGTKVRRERGRGGVGRRTFHRSAAREKANSTSFKRR